MEIIIRKDGQESILTAVKELIIEVYEDNSKNMRGYAEFHSLTSSARIQE
jgi:hypothetical protein